MLSIEWRCRVCRWGIVENRELVVARLRTIGMLTRDTPEEATLLELLPVAAARLPCSSCGAVGLRAELAPDDDPELWGDPIPCELCGGMIPAERLAIFPGSKVCAGCQGKLDRGESAGGVEYCPRCGAPLVLKPTHGGGVTRYQQICSQGCRPRR